MQDSRFKVSNTWIRHFKNELRIVSRKVNKFISRKTIENKDVLFKTNFINEIGPYIREYGTKNIFNSDQSGFQLEMHSGRTLAVEGRLNVWWNQLLRLRTLIQFSQ